ncbi:sulfotransferase domain-containing protein [Marinobacter mangrovi]|uniref:sulfotransferase domain-containing protein n=1 Tax=Marinobacter mangrovi TaxID=2803918 RepID=UPI001931FB91|nr:sulfotransferase domain-containing protein [Marinobacter mangrovi]
MTKKVDLIHIGPQKSGTTWLYECLKEHPGCQVSKRDTVHYFDIYYSQGESWLEQHYEGSGEGQLRIDMTPSYLRDGKALERIAEYNPSKGIALCLRDPIERAFSHYWHEKKKQRFNYSFKEVVENYDLWSSWVKPGLYAQKIKRCFDLVGRDRVLVQFFDDLKSNPEGFFSEFCEFSGLDEGFKPSVLEKKINSASPQLSSEARHRRAGARKALENAGLLKFAQRVKPALEFIPGVGLKAGNVEKLSDEDQSFVAFLYGLIESEVKELEELTNRDLSSWSRR